MQVAFTPAELIPIVGATGTRGATSAAITGLASLENAVPGDLAFLGNAKYRSQVAMTRASVVLLPKDFDGAPSDNQLYLLVDNPSVALAQVCARIEQKLWPKPSPGIHASAVIGAGAQVAATATIGPLCVIEAGAVVGERTHLQANVFVGQNAKIGDDCWLMPGVCLSAECILQNRVRLHAGVVVGSDGFGYEFVAGRHEKVPQVGNVLIEDDVEIGANSTLDRARFSRTVIGTGTKIDNLVQIAHNVIVGKHCILCAQVGISGSAVLEDYVILGGQAGVAGHITVGKGAKSGGRAGITSDVEPGKFVNGYPAIPYMLERRLQVLQRRLPELFKRVDSLEGK
ncbi:MAG: UDP-3-O-(3-hydroxymyristoyl)glucosamine N-acyltransferase [Cephaloticoccus sp.]|nr:UDP-3-O-(3-hydroxymyristoyl)glucosamine N-acyltransferase [Cephaloticoccus sp.]MCF7760393.1 UDP-3-O-(3-hydroxymyristoyl)glucosamine N-acyltransferase [Cephaloticoccus sp.]